MSSVLVALIAHAVNGIGQYAPQQACLQLRGVSMRGSAVSLVTCAAMDVSHIIAACQTHDRLSCSTAMAVR